MAEDLTRPRNPDPDVVLSFRFSSFYHLRSDHACYAE